MKINNVTKEKLVTVNYEVEREGETYLYTDYYLEDGRIVDSILRTADGYAVEVPDLLEEIQEFIGQSEVSVS